MGFGLRYCDFKKKCKSAFRNMEAVEFVKTSHYYVCKIKNRKYYKLLYGIRSMTADVFEMKGDFNSDVFSILEVHKPIENSIKTILEKEAQ